jgi:PAS domain S-box-containing protein
MLKARLIVFIALIFPVVMFAADPSLAGSDNLPDHPSQVIASGSELDYPPFSLVREDGSADGFSVELLKAVARATGLNVTFKVGPWHVIQRELVAGRLDALPLVSYSAERDKVFDFTAPYIRMHGAIFVRRGDKSIHDETDLKDKEVLVMRGDTAHEYLVRKQLSDKLILTDSFEDAMKQLSAGKHDAVVVQQLVGLQIIKKLHLSNLVSVQSILEASLKPAAEPLSGFEQKFCIAVKEGDKELLARLNEGLSIIISNGVYDKLYDKWFAPLLPQPGLDRATLIKYLFIILLPLLASIGIFGLWYLRREVDRKTQKLREQIVVCQATEESLVQTRDTLQAILDAAPAGVVVADNTGRILFSSTFTRHIFGNATTGKAFGSDSGYRVLKPDGAPIPQSGLPLSLALSGQAVFDKELLVRLDNGTQSIILASATPLRTEAAEIWGAVTVFQDITERQQSAKALAASERKYRELVETANSIIIRWDNRGIIRYINDFGLRFFGYSAEELLNRSLMTIVPKVETGSGRDLDALIKEIIVHPEVYAYVPNENITKDGRIVWVAWTNKAILDEQGKVQEILAIGNDITVLKQTEKALQNSNTRLELLTTVAQRLLRTEDPQAIIEELCRLVMDHIDCQLFFNYLVDVPGRSLLLNACAGIPAETVDSIRQLDFGAAVCGCAARDGKRIIAEHIGDSNDPRTQLVKSFGVQAFCCHPMKVQGELIGTLSFGTRTRSTFTADEVELMKTVTDKVAVAMQRLLATRALRASQERLQSSLAEKEVLLKEIHHRVKNNMQVISSLVDLQADEVQDAAMRDIFKDVNYRVRSMAMVHEKLYQSTDLARVEFADYAQSLMRYLWRAQGAAASGIRLSSKLKPVFLPVNAAVPCGLILNELFSNALKHAFKGRSRGNITVSLDSDRQGRVHLCVGDNGIGLPPELDWQNAHSLGLRLVHMLARQLQAAVEVVNDAGTEFRITFEGHKSSPNN